jgi:hypothetical protein
LGALRIALYRLLGRLSVARSPVEETGDVFARVEQGEIIDVFIAKWSKCQPSGVASDVQLCHRKVLARSASPAVAWSVARHS